MDRALVIGGTRFIGRHTVETLLTAGYEVTMFNRGTRDDPFDDRERVTHVEGDRTNESALEVARNEVAPDVVIDCVAYHPRDVRAATAIFETVDAYVYVSSGAAYAREDVPKREDHTPLEPCTDAQATDDSMETYAARKAEGDRAIVAAADRGVNAMSVRPPIVYGPHDYTERLDYWIDRVNRFDRVIVPGDGTNIWHRAYVGDVASALVTVAESGHPGEAYNVGDGHAPTLQETVELIADALETAVEVVTAGPRELGAADLSMDDFVLYRGYPHLLDTCKLQDLGWTATPTEATIERSVAAHLESPRTGRDHGPDREAEERVLAVLDTV